MKLTNYFLETLATLTFENEHTLARLKIAKKFKLDKYIKIFKAIYDIQEVEGYMPTYINQYRHKVQLDMFNEIKALYGQETVDLLKEHC